MKRKAIKDRQQKKVESDLEEDKAQGKSYKIGIKKPPVVGDFFVLIL